MFIKRFINDYKETKDFMKAKALWLFYYFETEEFDSKLSEKDNKLYSINNRSYHSEHIYNEINKIAIKYDKLHSTNIFNQFENVKKQVSNLSTEQRKSNFWTYYNNGLIDFVFNAFNHDKY